MVGGEFVPQETVGPCHDHHWQLEALRQDPDVAEHLEMERVAGCDPPEMERDDCLQEVALTAGRQQEALEPNGQEAEHEAERGHLQVVEQDDQQVQDGQHDHQLPQDEVWEVVDAYQHPSHHLKVACCHFDGAYQKSTAVRNVVGQEVVCEHLSF